MKVPAFFIMNFIAGDKVRWLCTMGDTDIWLEGCIEVCVGKDDVANTDFFVYKVTVTHQLGKKQTRWVREDQLTKI